MAVDLNYQAIWFRFNGGQWNLGGNPSTNSGGINISNLSGVLYPGCSLFTAVGESFTANFGASAYSYAPPAGFSNWGVQDYVYSGAVQPQFVAPNSPPTTVLFSQVIL